MASYLEKAECTYKGYLPCSKKKKKNSSMLVVAISHVHFIFDTKYQLKLDRWGGTGQFESSDYGSE